MGSRLKLHSILVALLGSGNVYYQPPSTITMKYPAIVYSRDKIQTKYANDVVYGLKTSYEIIVIDANPDSIIIEKVALLPSCAFNRNYTSDNLNHDAFTLYF